ncbi:MAG TPA: hypothetical protein DCM02_03255 [Flavobacterium sp.]|nr:hypothetical protein [Flavobacterium sp.]HAT75702.1 hypothetical protein [Flavobacterium sp.]HAT81442.1 hypothetical protein [Flavobacterium sp.]
MKSNQLEFVVFILNKFASASKLPVSEVYQRLDSLHIIDDYIIKHYEVLHTVGENYLIEDLNEMLTQKSIQK